MDGFLTQKQVLELIPISKSTLWRRVQDGSIPKPVKLGRRVLWHKQRLAKTLRQMTEPDE
jgi:predicted DNA-binding transcriptional regulator AlpA